MKSTEKLKCLVSEKVKVQLMDNINWIEHADEHKLVYFVEIFDDLLN